MSSLCSMQIMYNSLTIDFKRFLVSPCDYYLLPSEIWQIILDLLMPTDLYNLMSSNKTFLKIVLEHSDYLLPQLLYILPNNENHFISRLDIFDDNNHLWKKIKFINLLNIFNFGNSFVLLKYYNNKKYILGECFTSNDDYDYYNNKIDHLESVSLYTANIRYGLFKTFYNGDFEISREIITLIKYARNEIFEKIFLIIIHVPSFLSIVNIKEISAIHNFLIINEHRLTMKEIINIFKSCVFYGGDLDRMLYLINSNYHYNYINALMCGLKEKDAFYYTIKMPWKYSVESLLTFKSLVPIVGYDYAKMFLLDLRYNLDDYPYFVQVASLMNSRNYFCIDKCVGFSKTGASIDKIFTLRNRKRPFEK